jgi:Ser/Thr protein kinase RdoA (MazF antagonist)
VSELVGAVLTRPTTDVTTALAILREHWAPAGDVVLRSLPSERDRNFAVTIDGQDRYVLKVSNANESHAFLDLQHRAMERLATAGVPCQRAVAARDGREVTDLGSASAPMLARLLTWLPGRPLATVPATGRTPELLADLGRVMGRTAATLMGFDHPAAHRDFQWSAEQGLDVIRAHAGAVRDPERATLLDRWLERLARLTDRFPTLRHGVIHNDANDHNVLVAEDGDRITGLLDLGDAVWSILVTELAVAAAYAALGAREPLAVVASVRSGFVETLPLTDIEDVVLLDLVALRLATSVALSAHQASLAPDDPYLTVSEAPAWALLDTLLRASPS